MATKTLKIGLLIIVLALTSVMVTMDDVRLKINPASSVFYTYENGWVTAGTDYNYLYNGTKSISRTNTLLTNQIVGNSILITRSSTYGKATIVDTYMFDGGIKDKQLFPVYHTVKVLNAKGLIYNYQVKNLAYGGPTRLNVSSPQSFGHNMKVYFQDGWYWNKLTTSTLSVKYKISSDNESYQVRLYDPAWEGLVVNGTTFTDASPGKIEVGYPIEIKGVCDPYSTSYLSISDFPSGTNFTSGFGNSSYNWTTWSGTTLLNDTASAIYSYSSLSNKTIFLMNASNYSEYYQAWLNLTGVSNGTSFPTNVKIYINDSLSNSFSGPLSSSGAIATLTTFNDSSISKIASFSGAQTNTAYIRIPKSSVLKNAVLNITTGGLRLIESVNKSTWSNTSGMQLQCPTCTGNSGGYDNYVNWNGNVTDGNWTTYGGVQVWWDSSAASFDENYTFEYRTLNGGSPLTVVNITNKFGFSHSFNGYGGTAFFYFYVYAWNYTSNGYSQIYSNTGTVDGTTTANTSVTLSSLGITTYNSTTYLKTMNELKATAANTPSSYEATLAMYVYEEEVSQYTYPYNIYLDAGGDGAADYSYTEEINTTTNIKTTNLSSAIQSHLSGCTADSDGFCTVPFVFYSGRAGTMSVQNMTINYTSNFNPIKLNYTLINNYIRNTATTYPNYTLNELGDESLNWQSMMDNYALNFSTTSTITAMTLPLFRQAASTTANVSIRIVNNLSSINTTEKAYNPQSSDVYSAFINVQSLTYCTGGTINCTNNATYRISNLSIPAGNYFIVVYTNSSSAINGAYMGYNTTTSSRHEFLWNNPVGGNWSTNPSAENWLPLSFESGNYTATSVSDIPIKIEANMGNLTVNGTDFRYYGYKNYTVTNVCQKNWLNTINISVTNSTPTPSNYTTLTADRNFGNICGIRIFNGAVNVSNYSFQDNGNSTFDMGENITFWVSSFPVTNYTMAYNNISAMACGNSSAANYLCYQEHANVSTSCGGLNTGLYSIAGPYVYVNYSKPSNYQNSSLWQIRHGSLNIYNVSIPTNCWNNNKMMLRMYSWYDWSPVISYGQCYNSSDWINITNISSGEWSAFTGSYDMKIFDGDWNTGSSWWVAGGNKWGKDTYPTPATWFEEAMWWNITWAGNNGVWYNTTTLSSSSQAGNLLLYWSNYSINMPTSWWQVFPRTVNSTNVTPWGQNSTTPIFNITYYGEYNASFGLRLDQLISKINITSNTANNQSTGFIMNTTFLNYGATNMTYGYKFGLWQWVDLFNVNSSAMRWINPNMTFATCCIGCMSCGW